MKETRLRRVRIIWFHSHEILEQIKLIYNEKNQKSYYLGWAKGEGMTGNEQKGIF